MCPLTTNVVFKMQKPVLSLKQFMLRSEIIKLYRGFLRLGRFLDEPPPLKNDSNCTKNNTIEGQNISTNPMKDEWIQWIRAEFRLRQVSSTDEEMTRALLAYGKRQLQEMERTMMLATNKNMPSVRNKSKSTNNKSLNIDSKIS